MAKAKPSAAPSNPPNVRAMNVSQEAAAAAATASANQDPAFLAELREELEHNGMFKVPEVKAEKPTEPKAEEPAPAAEEPETPAAEEPQPEAQPTEPKAEEPAEPAAEPEAPAAEEPAQPDPMKVLSDELAKLRGEISSLREENTKLSRDSAQTTTNAQAPVNPVRLEDRVLAADTPEALDALAAEYGALQDRCIENPDGFEVETQPGQAPRVVTAEEVRRLLVESNRVMRQIPTRAREITQTQAADRQALELFPAFNDPRSTEAQLYARLTTLAPQLRRLPNLRTFIGDAVANERARASGSKAAKPAEQKVGPNGKPLPGAPVARKAAPPPVPTPPARAASSASTADLAKRRSLIDRQASGKGGSDNLIDLVDALLPSKTARRAG